jgi:hypothetical protein
MSSTNTTQTLDSGSWIHGCFMVKVGTDFKTYKEIIAYAERDESYGTNGKVALEPAVKKILADSTAMPTYFSKRKCRDSSLGGNDAINPLPQFSMDDDIAHPYTPKEYGAPISMGQVYSENYDDTQQILYLGFGIPAFTDLASFWGGAVDMDLAGFVNKGSGITLEKIGYLIGSAPIRLIKIATIPWKFLGAMANTLEQVPVGKYYSFSSQMPMYFRFVNTILVMLATNMNMMGSASDYPGTGSTTSGATPLGLVEGGTKSTDNMNSMSDVFRNRGLDMARIMSKRYLYENGNQGLINNRYTDQSLFDAAAVDNGNGVASPPDAKTTTNQSSSTATPSSDTLPGFDGGNSVKSYFKKQWFDAFALGVKDAIYDGHLFIGFRIDKGMGASESFSNSTGESQIAQVANAKFQEGRDAAFDTMNGSFGSGALGSTLDGVVSGAKGLLEGLMGTLKLDPLAATLTGEARIDIPEVWMNSSFSRSASFSLTCLAPYGDFETIFQSEYVPLACILAGALPRGTGQSSHSSPFICQAYCRGVFASPLCMIESLEVTRGADQFGFSAARLPLKLSIHVGLKDLSPIMAMNLGGDRGICEELLGFDDSFQEYMLTLAGTGLRERLAPFKALKRKWDILISTVYKNKLSPYMLGMEGGSQFLISRMISTVISGGKGLPGN